MKELINKLLKPPAFEHDSENAHRTEIIHYVSIAVFAFSVSLLLVNFIFRWSVSPLFYWLVGATAVTQIFIQWLIRSKYVKHGGVFLITLLWMVLTFISRVEGGVRDTSMLGYILLLLTAAILLGWRYTSAYTLASIVVIWWLAYLELSGQLVPDLGAPDEIAFLLTLMFVLILLVIYFLLRALTNALDKANRELTERIRVEAELERLAHTDALTGLFNRLYFMEVAEKEFAESIRYERPVSIIIFDIDHFKRVNDTHGHLGGDQALIHLGALLRKHVREADTAARYGGEEFIVLLPETNLDGAKIFAERLRVLIENSAVQYGEIVITFTVSIGVAAQNTLEKTIVRADQSLYTAKETGRNRVVCYHVE